MPRYAHFGLYFTPAQVESASKHRTHAPYAAAWTALDTLQPSDPIAAAVIQGLRWRFQDDAEAGEEAVRKLLNGIGLEGGGDYLTALWSGAALAHTVELVRDHPAFAAHTSPWMNRFAERIDQLNLTPNNAGFVDHIWLGLVNLLAGIVLEDDRRFEQGTAIFQKTIREDVRPEGYLPRAVEGHDGGSLWRQLLASGALVLMAEAAAHVGVDLWNVESRGISVITAASYSLYYYYYPDQWRWDPMNEELARPLFQEWSGFIEIANRHARLRDVRLMLDELRPFFNPAAGGLTTLSHCEPPRRGLFG